MKRSGETTNITRLLKKHRPGEWVVLNQAMTEVLASGRNPKEAAARATKKKIASRDQFLFRVPDPKTVCIY